MNERAELRIGEVAALAGVSTRMIRHYHHAGVLPEPERTSNGYRCYGVREVVLLLRVRQLVDLGLNLDEVRDVLAESGGRDMREVLIQLDADLAEAQQRIAVRRARLAALLSRTERTGESTAKEAVLRELSQIAGHDREVLDRERLAVDLIELSVDPSLVPETWETYRNVLGDDATAQALLELSRRFDTLLGLDPHDRAVDALAADAADIGDAVAALLPPEVRNSPGDPAAADRLLRIMQVSADPAQARCLSLMFDGWRERAT